MEKDRTDNNPERNAENHSLQKVKPHSRNGYVLISLAIGSAWVLPSVAENWDKRWMQVVVWVFGFGCSYCVFGFLHETARWKASTAIVPAFILFASFSATLLIAYAGGTMPSYLKSQNTRFLLPVILTIVALLSWVRALRPVRSLPESKDEKILPTQHAPSTTQPPSITPHPTPATTPATTPEPHITDGRRLDEWQQSSTQAGDASTMAIPHESSDRIFVAATRDELAKQFESHTSSQAKNLAKPYVGKWIRVSGTVRDVRDGDNSITVFISESDSKTLYPIIAGFAINWKPRIEVIRKGERLVVTGRIDKLDARWLFLKDCELVQPGNVHGSPTTTPVPATATTLADSRKPSTALSSSQSPDAPPQTTTLPDGRVAMIVTLDYVIGLYTKSTFLQGKNRVPQLVSEWLIVTATVKDIQPNGDDFHATFSESVTAFFDRAMKNQLEVLNAGDKLTLLGRFRSVYPENKHLYLNDCEILQRG